MKKVKMVIALIAIVVCTTSLAMAQKHCSKMKNAYVETGKMKLKAGVTDEQFIAIEKRIREGRIKKQEGFISREFGKDTEGFWFFIIKWDSKEHGDAWTPIFQNDPDGQAMMNALDFSTVRQEHFTEVEVK